MRFYLVIIFFPSFHCSSLRKFLIHKFSCSIITETLQTAFIFVIAIYFHVLMKLVKLLGVVRFSILRCFVVIEEEKTVFKVFLVENRAALPKNFICFYFRVIFRTNMIIFCIKYLIYSSSMYVDSTFAARICIDSV